MGRSRTEGEPLFAPLSAALVRRTRQAGVARHSSAVTHCPRQHLIDELCAELHNRMPAVLKPEMWPAWLGEEPATVRDLKAMLAPYPSEDMISWPVSTRVGHVKNNDHTLIEPIAAA